jgi:SnoaL-like domain
MTGQSRGRLLAVALACCGLLTGFWTGWLASRHVVLAPLKTAQPGLQPVRGDAPESSRAEVLRALRAFQEGYTRRDVDDIGRFMERLFQGRKDDLFLGTDAGEWNRGYDDIAEIIRRDWRGWGDVRLDVEDSTISAAGDVAWLATPGTVSIRGSPRPIRFTAILVRDDRRWLFRQVQFQWENDSPSPSQFLAPSTLRRLRWR